MRNSRSGEAADEYLLMGLRLAEGIDTARYSALSGRDARPKAHFDIARRRRRRNDRRWPLARHQERLSASRCSGGGSRRLTLGPRRKCVRGRADDLAACRRHAQDRQPTFVGAIGAEAEDAIDPRKPRRVGQHLFAESLRRLASLPALRPAPPRHRQASPCAPGPGRSARDSAPRNCGSRWIQARHTSRHRVPRSRRCAGHPKAPCPAVARA